ncbi:hypothetical protein D3C85_1296070 [compost metagenome]
MNGAGVVHQHRDGPEALLGLGHRSVHLFGVRNVRREEAGAAASGVDPLGHGRAVTAGQVEDGNLGAFTREELGGGQPAATRATGDQRHLVVQSSHGCLHCYGWIRPFSR